MVWPTLPVADLITHVPALPDADPALTESIQDTGVQEPLYIATLGDGTYRVVDGLRRLASAVAAALDTVPVTYRPVIRVGALDKHPGNVRQDLKLTKEFRTSIRENGVRTAILIRRTDAGLEVVDGHRRLLGAIAEKVSHIPYTYDEVSDASAYVDMVATAVHRESLTAAEQATALFQAAELGATTKQLAAAAGSTQKDAKTLVKVGQSKAVAKVGAANLTLTDLARIAELEETAPDLAEEVEAAIAEEPGANHGWRIHEAARKAENRQRAAEHRAKLEATGAQFREIAELSEKARPVNEIKGLKWDGAAHADCKGDAWVLEYPNASSYTRYCTNVALYGHAIMGEAKKITKGERKRIITGNGAWDAAVAVRQEWLAGLIGRKTHPRATTDVMLRIAAEAMLSADHVIQNKQSHPKRTALLGAWLGMPEGKRTHKNVTERAATVRRNPAHLFAVIAACYELYIPRTTWRTDGHHAHSQARTDAARYLGWLAELGYEPTPIEQAAASGAAYDPTAQTAPAAEQVEAEESGTLA